MRSLIFIFLSVFSIANSQNKRNDDVFKDPTLQIPEGYYNYQPEGIIEVCGSEYVSKVNAENYEYNFYKKDNHVYYQGKLKDINGNGFLRLGLNYFKNNESVYYYRKDLGLQKVPGADPKSSRILDSFLVDKNYLYFKTLKVIESKDLKTIVNNIKQEEPIVENTTNNSNLPSDYYIFKNNKGYWLLKRYTIMEHNGVSYNFLGKTYDPEWNKVSEKSIFEDNYIYNAMGVDTKPEYPGGTNELYNFIKKEYRIPNEEGLKGKVYTTFVIEKNGVLSAIKILRDIGYGTGDELIRVLKLSPKWTPAVKNGQKVRCMYSFPYPIQQY